MKVLRAAVVLGLSTPLVVLACGSDDNSTAQRGSAGEGGDAAGGADGSSGSNSTAGKAAAGSTNGGVPPGEGGAAGGGAADTGGAGAVANAGAGGGETEPEPACGDGTVEGGLVCFADPLPFVVGEGAPTDVAIGAWDAADGLDVLVASPTGLAYFSNHDSGGFTTSTTVGTAGAVLGAGQLDAGDHLDLLLGQANAGTSIVAFGDGAGAAPKIEPSGFNSEGVLFNYFVADVTGSGASEDVVVTFNNSISLVLTTGTEGEGFQGPIQSIYPPTPQDSVLATLGSSQWLVYSTETNITRQLMTYDAGAVTLGPPLATPAGGTASQLDVADFDEDGFDDVAATLTGSSNVSVLFADGVGTGDFTLVTDADHFLTLSTGAGAAAVTTRDVKAGDFNGDGHADLAVSVEGLDAVAIFSGDGKGAFSGPELVSTGAGSGPTRLAVGDLNGDAVDDLAVIGKTSSRVIIVLSTP
jgi:hypothetical protein